MNEQCLFNFRPNCLVRMSKDDIIDQYDIFPIKIGEGNDAVVYKAKEKIDNGLWRAVKKIHRRYVEKEEYLLTEIQILKKLDHPGVLKIFEVFDDSEYVFIVTELCEGDSLLQQLKRRQYFPQTEAKVIFKKIIQIIAYCHQNKIIHRDLKLQNLVYCSKQHIPQSLRLIDFGMSFHWQTNARIQVKNTFKTNKIVGTIYYMAPQIHKETYDHRVDIWSAGVILFFLLTGELPFFQDEDEDILEAIQQRNVPYEKLTERKCSKQVIQLLKKMFETESKRISIQQILKHPWVQSLDVQNLRLSKQTLHYFSLIPFKEFEILQDYYTYCRQRIFQISYTQNIDPTPSFSNKNLLKTLNWNNVYEFLKMNPIQKAIKIYLTYRLGQDKSQRYNKIFDHFKSNKQHVQLQTLYEHLHLEYQSFLSKLDSNSHGSLKKGYSTNKVQRKMSLQDQKAIFSVKKIYKELLTFFQHNKYNSISHTMFVSWICDYSQFEQKQLEFLRKNLHVRGYEVSQRDPLETQILRIHKIVRHQLLQKKKKSKSQCHYSITISPIHNENDTSTLKYRHIPKLTLNIEKDPNTHLYVKTPKKSIKQNILESISPTFIRRKPIQKIPQSKGSQTQRPKGSRLLSNQRSEGGFLNGIQKIISFL